MPRTILKKRINLSFSFKSSWCNSSYSSNRPSAKQFCSDDLCRMFCIYPSWNSSCDLAAARVMAEGTCLGYVPLRAGVYAIAFIQVS